jgi:hypothetical protein
VYMKSDMFNYSNAVVVVVAHERIRVFPKKLD